MHVLSIGRSIVLYKDVGLPAEIAERYAFAKLTGTHPVGHTRMGTDSAVTAEDAHPYTVGEDWCMVHNGSLANLRVRYIAGEYGQSVGISEG